VRSESAMPGTPSGKKSGKQTWRAQARENPTIMQTSVNPAEIEDMSDALTMAAMQGNDEVIGTLVAAGVDVDAKDAIGVAPLHWAAFCGHEASINRLIDAGADVHTRDQEGRTPLHVAAYESHLDVIARLVKADADVMAPDKMGWTPLHCAVSNSEEQACKALTDSGADPLRKDMEGKTAMDLAKHFGHTEIVTLLEGANDQKEVLDLRSLGIGSHRGSKDPASTSPTSVSSPLAAAAAQ